MLKWINYLASIMVILIFLMLAFASDGDDHYNNITCDPIDEKYYENGYVTCNPVEYVEKQNDILLTILDKVTQEGIEGLHVKVSWNQFYLDTVHCDGQCFGLLTWDENVEALSGGYSVYTDANGKIDFRTGVGYHEDQRDVQLVSMRIEDPNGKYASRLISARFTHNVSLYQQAIYLLNNESL